MTIAQAYKFEMNNSKLIILLIQFASAHAIEIYVGKIQDSLGSSGLCGEPENITDSNDCNLRSAWSLCTEIVSEKCSIYLPVGASVEFNSTLGALILDQEMNVEIDGRGASINCYKSYSR